MVLRVNSDNWQRRGEHFGRGFNQAEVLSVPTSAVKEKAVYKHTFSRGPTNIVLRLIGLEHH